MAFATALPKELLRAMPTLIIIRRSMKDTTFSIRISAEDLATIKQKARQARLSQSDYVTRCCLGKQVVIVEGLKEVMKQQKAIGNNLNQLTTLANRGRVTVITIEAATNERSQISNKLRASAKTGGWSK